MPTAPSRPTAFPLPTGELPLLAVAVLASSLAAPLTLAAAAPALALAFWRNALAAGGLGLLLVRRPRATLADLTAKRVTWSVGAGVLLAGHFGAWMTALSSSSVATVTALVATQPVWTALIARAGGHRLRARAWAGIALAVLGAGVVGGVDAVLATGSALGVALALAGGLFGAGYVSLGGVARATMSTSLYTLLCYGAAAVVLLPVCLVARQPLLGYGASTWVVAIALTIGPQLLGHSLFNRALRAVSPTVVSLAMLLITPIAAVIAWLGLGQTPSIVLVPAIAVLLSGIALVLCSAGSPRRAGSPGPDRRVCVVGDSFVAGVGDPDHLGWVGRLLARTHTEIGPVTGYGLGVRRETSAQVRARWRAECRARWSPGSDNRLVVSFGVNDTTWEHGATRVPSADSVAHLAGLLDEARDDGLPTFVVGPPPVADDHQNARIAALDRAFDELCRARDVPYVSITGPLLEDARWGAEVRSGDGSHPGRSGYQDLADLVWPAWAAWIAP